MNITGTSGRGLDVVEVGVRGEQPRVLACDRAVELGHGGRRRDLSFDEQVDHECIRRAGQPLGEEQVGVHSRDAPDPD